MSSMGKARSATKREIRALEGACRAQVRRFEEAIRLSDIPDVRALCDAIGALRGRPIVVEALPLPPPQTGLWLAGRQTDYIYYARDASPPYQDHIVLHELAHMLRGHRSVLHEEADMLQRAWYPLLDPEAIRAALDSALARSSYDFAHEREAELLASLIEQRWRHARPRAAEAHGSDEPPSAVRWLREQANDGG